jgi:hypothetical protein
MTTNSKESSKKVNNLTLENKSSYKDSVMMSDMYSDVGDFDPNGDDDLKSSKGSLSI